MWIFIFSFFAGNLIGNCWLSAAISIPDSEQRTVRVNNFGSCSLSWTNYRWVAILAYTTKQFPFIVKTECDLLVNWLQSMNSFYVSIDWSLIDWHLLTSVHYSYQLILFGWSIDWLIFWWSISINWIAQKTTNQIALDIPGDMTGPTNWGPYMPHGVS